MGLILAVGRVVSLSPAGGGDMVGLCPFHAEKTPSFRVNDRRYKCFGCGAKGGIRAWEELYPETVEDKDRVKAVVPCEDWTRDECEQVLELVEFVHHQAMMRLESALPYLKSRGITKQMARDWGLGYLPNDICVLPHLRDICDKARLLTKKGACMLAGRVVFPAYSLVTDELVGLQGRAIYPDFEPKYILWVPKPFRDEAAFFDPVDDSPPVVVEGVFDAIHQPGGVALFGCTPTHTKVRRLRRRTGQAISWCYDNDRAGREAMLSLAQPGDNVMLLTLAKDLGEAGERPASYLVEEKMEILKNKKHQDALKKYLQANVKEGYASMNVVQFAERFDDSGRLHQARVAYQKDPSDDNGRELLRAWKAVCAKVRAK